MDTKLISLPITVPAKLKPMDTVLVKFYLDVQRETLQQLKISSRWDKGFR